MVRWLLFVVELETHNAIAVDGGQPCALLEFARRIVFLGSFGTTPDVPRLADWG